MTAGDAPARFSKKARTCEWRLCVTAQSSLLGGVLNRRAVTRPSNQQQERNAINKPGPPENQVLNSAQYVLLFSWRSWEIENESRPVRPQSQIQDRWERGIAPSTFRCRTKLCVLLSHLVGFGVSGWFDHSSGS
jgi:hypothetical protein